MLVIGAIARFLSFFSVVIVAVFFLFLFLLPCILVNKVVYITTVYASILRENYRLRASIACMNVGSFSPSKHDRLSHTAARGCHAVV